MAGKFIIVAWLAGAMSLAAVAQSQSMFFPFQTSYARAFRIFVKADPGIVYPDVADATARLSLLGISAGYRVHQVDNNTVYQYNGPSTAAVAGMIVAGTPSLDGIYAVDSVINGKNDYVTPPSGGGVGSIRWNGSVWEIFGDASEATSASNVATPDLATWTGGVTVTIDHIASTSNWSVVP